MSRMPNSRARSFEQDHFDLLPFINILMCILGLLLLIALSFAGLTLREAPEVWSPCTGESASSESQIPCTRGGFRRMPVLVEWDGKLILIHMPHGLTCTVPPKLQRTGVNCPAELDALPYAELLRYFEARARTHYALIAVRPSGFDDFDSFADMFRSRKIGIGFEPIEQQRKIRLDLRSFKLDSGE
jgi:hypothetical protein